VRISSHIYRYQEKRGRKLDVNHRGSQMIQLDSRTTALVLIDLQKGIVGRELAPYTGEQVVKTARELADRFRRVDASVVLVNVCWSKDFKDGLRQIVDQPLAMPPGGFPEDFSELIDGLAKPGDILITKRQWGAFYGTELDLQLRRRGIKTIVLAGIATNFGVESTARQAWEQGYELVIAEDACTSMSTDLHHMAIRHIFPRIGRVMQGKDVGVTSA
jgi:nicotinamidase-related amidase